MMSVLQVGHQTYVLHMHDSLNSSSCPSVGDNNNLFSAGGYYLLST